MRRSQLCARRLAQWHRGIQHALGPVRCLLGAAPIRREEVATAGEILVARAASLRRHGDPDALLARVAAQLGEALATPPLEAGAPVARRLLAVEPRRGALEDDARAQARAIREDRRVLDVRADSQPADEASVC